MPALKKSKSPLKSSVGKEIFSRSANKPLSPEEAFETNETQFWAEVAKKSESLITTLIEKVLPISATPSTFGLEKDTDYRTLLRDDLPNSYQDQEEYLEKITSGNWTEADVEFVAKELTCAYFDLVAKSLADWLSEYPNFESSSLSQLKE